MHRIFITGLSGSGKSTLARDLSKATGIPAYHADTMIIRDKAALLPEEEQRQRLELILAQDHWILDACPKGYRDRVIDKMDGFVLLATPDGRRRWNLVKRVWKNRFLTRNLVNVQQNPFNFRFYLNLFKKQDALWNMLSSTADIVPDHVRCFQVENAAQRQQVLDEIKSAQRPLGNGNRAAINL